MLGGAPLVVHVRDRLAQQTNGPIAINVAGEGFDAESIKGVSHVADHPVIPDLLPPGTGPLAGLHCAMTWAKEQGASGVMTSPTDIPFLPLDFAARLAAVNGPAIAVSPSGLHPLCGYWPVQLLPMLEEKIADGLSAARHWARAIGVAEVLFSPTGKIDPFFNINRREDLSRAEMLIAARKPD